jgi:hypothetical protein
MLDAGRLKSNRGPPFFWRARLLLVDEHRTPGPRWGDLFMDRKASNQNIERHYFPIFYLHEEVNGFTWSESDY